MHDIVDVGEDGNFKEFEVCCYQSFSVRSDVRVRVQGYRISRAHVEGRRHVVRGYIDRSL